MCVRAVAELLCMSLCVHVLVLHSVFVFVFVLLLCACELVLSVNLPVVPACSGWFY